MKVDKQLIADCAALLRIRCNVEAMIADNKRREMNGISLAYDESDFYSMGSEAEEIENRLRNKKNK